MAAHPQPPAWLVLGHLTAHVAMGTTARHLQAGTMNDVQDVAVQWLACLRASYTPT